MVKDLSQLPIQIQHLAEQQGFSRIGFTNTDLRQYAPRFKEWLKRNFHGEMSYLADHKTERLQPETCVPGTITVISVTMNYLPPATNPFKSLLNNILHQYSPSYLKLTRAASAGSI